MTKTLKCYAKSFVFFQYSAFCTKTDETNTAKSTSLVSKTSLYIHISVFLKRFHNLYTNIKNFFKIQTPNRHKDNLESV